MNVIEFPTRSLTPIDIRAVKVVSAALGWGVQIDRSAESEDVLNKFGDYPEPPYELTRGSPETALMALPRSPRTSI